MSWAGKQHPVETAIEWLAPIPLALAVGWAGGQLGIPIVAATMLALPIFAIGFVAIRSSGRTRRAALRDFEPAMFASEELGELILEEQDAVLELNDRLELPDPDSRIVRLFAREDPTPGELVDRIAHFLGEGGRPEPSERSAANVGRPPDASAALHDALANIRASLR